MRKCERRISIDLVRRDAEFRQKHRFWRVLEILTCIVLWTAVLLIQTNPAHAQCESDEWRCQSLEGLPGVFLFVIVDQGAKDFGLREEDVRNDVGLKLRSAGIKILTDDDKVRGDVRRIVPMLFVQLTTVRTEVDEGFFLHAIHTDLEFQQLVELRTALRIPAFTWSKSTTGLYGPLAIRTVRGDIVDLVSQFANDFLTANPK